MGHASHDVVKDTINSHEYGTSAKDSDYINCLTGLQSKQAKARAKEKLVHNSPNVTIHSNVYGLIQTESVAGIRYLRTMITTPQHYLNVLLLRQRNEATQHAFNYIARVDWNCKRTAKRVHTDNFTEILAM